ncbi:RNA polymerase sigma factor [Luteirhabdus pelagi]|uniref:RNA polymerase sigma factor n=1 Tax=Luteirhabdus pelagi TaxID=2792783 RepID=UPI00193A29E1|nr:sigma-70 family RNA polymerase sigma factor [Luteirhabdus pelagi]
MQEHENVCNEGMFSQIYNEHSESVYRFIYFKCGDEAQASDLVQDAFIKLWQNCKKVMPSKAKSFLYTVTRNAFYNEVAHQKVVLKHAKLQPTKVENQSPEFLLEEKQYHKKVQQVIESLTEAQRTAFLLNRIEGKKYAEIAEMLDISVKAVEKRMSQALAVIRKEIGDI